MFVFIGTKNREGDKEMERVRDRERERGDRNVYMLSFWMNANQTLDNIRNGNLIQRLATKVSISHDAYGIF